MGVHRGGYVRRRPLVGVALAFIAGTLLGLHVEASVPRLIVADIMALAGWWITWRRGDASSRTAAACSLLFTIVVAWTAVVLHGAGAGGGGVAGPMNASGTITVTGVIEDCPDLPGEAARSGEPVRYRMAVESIRVGDGADRPWRGALRLNWFGSAESRYPHYGERWMLTGWMRPPRPGTKVGRPGSLATLTVSRGQSRFLSAGHGHGFRSACFRAREASGRLLALGIDDYPAETGLFRALVLGYRTQLAPEWKDVFKATGTLHVFAISGLHVAMVGVFIAFGLRALRIPSPCWAFGMVPLLAGYTMMTGAAASAVRAGIMGMAAIAAPLFGRRADSGTTLGLAAMLILAAAPWQVEDPGFVLSFVAVVGLMTVLPVFQQATQAWGRRDPLLPEAESRWTRWGRGTCRSVVSLACISCAAWLTSTPILAFYFGQLSIIALLSNMVVVPISFLIVLAGSLSLVLGSCLECFALVFNHAALVLIAAMTTIVRWMAAVPWSNVTIKKPPLFAVLLWYGVLGVLVFGRYAWSVTCRELPGGSEANEEAHRDAEGVR